MPLVSPAGNSLVGNLVRLRFDAPPVGVTAEIGGVACQVLSDGADFSVKIVGQPAGQWLTIRGTERRSDGSVSSWEVIVTKPRHDTAGLGSTLLRDAHGNPPGSVLGAFFKVWLPGPNKVYVRGDFNDWKDVDPLDPLDDTGYWFGFVPGATANQSYKFYAYLPNGDNDEVPDPAARRTIKTPKGGPDSRDANAVICDPAAFSWLYDGTWADRRRSFASHLIYQLHCGTWRRFGSYSYERFARGDTIAAKRSWVADRLESIAAMGFTCVELLPIEEANGNTDAGYDPSHFWAVEDAYGEPDDLRILVDEAHRRGLAVIFDAVFNHVTLTEEDTSLCHPYLKPYYIKNDAPWSNSRQWGGDPWGWFPDFSRHEIQRYFIDCAVMYFEEYHVDGIRFDATKCFPEEGLRALIGELRGRYHSAGKYLIAEHIDDDPFDYPIHRIGFDAVWHRTGFNQIIGDSFEHSNLSALESAFLTCADGIGHTAIKYYAGSHDEIWANHGGKATVARFGGPGNFYARSKVRMAWAIAVCAPGTPMLFMGTEVLAPMDWENYYGYNGNNKNWSGSDLNWDPPGGSAAAQMKTMVTDLNGIRRDCAALRYGVTKTVHFDPKNGIVVFKRWDNDGCVLLIVINVSDNQWERRDYSLRTDTPNSTWHEIFNTQHWGYGGWASSGNGDPSFYPGSNAEGWLQGVNVPKWSVMIFKQQL